MVSSLTCKFLAHFSGRMLRDTVLNGLAADWSIEVRLCRELLRLWGLPSSWIWRLTGISRNLTSKRKPLGSWSNYLKLIHIGIHILKRFFADLRNYFKVKWATFIQNDLPEHGMTKLKLVLPEHCMTKTGSHLIWGPLN